MLNGLDLFSGIGGLTLALREWVRPVAYCENDQFAQSVLLSRIAKGELPGAPIWDDVRTLLGSFSKPVDIIYGGFPCQDISVAGHGKGLEGKRSGLVFEIFRLIDESGPSFVFLENVPAIRTRGAERVGKELAGRGYDCRWTGVSAAEVGAPHLRKRWFLLSKRRGTVADANSERLEKSLPGQTTSEKRPSSTGTSWWATEPDVGRVANGVPLRVDRIRALGNAVVPLQARRAFTRLMGL